MNEKNVNEENMNAESKGAGRAKVMDTADGILRMFREKKAAGRLLKKYAEAKRSTAAMENCRGTLLKVIGAVPGEYRWDDYYRYRERLASVNIPKEDSRLLTEYVDSLEVMNIVEVAVRERLREENRDIAEDLFIGAMPTGEIMKKYGVCERTVRNIKKRGMSAIEKELACRIGCGRRLSSAYI